MIEQLRALLILILFLLVTSCSLFIQEPDYIEEPLVLVVVPEHSQYNPGEAVVCRTYLYNVTGKELTVRDLNARSVSFWKGIVGKAEVFKFTPIFSGQENMLETKTLGPNESTIRPFVLTNITETSGTFSLQAVYNSAPDLMMAPRYTVISPKVEISVQGPRALQRDRNGILLRTDAIRIAKETVNDKVTAVEATLVENEAGFLDWWVVLHLEGGSSQDKEVKRAFLVNPYLGSIRTEVDPSITPPKKEPRDFQVRVKKETTP